MAIDYCLHLFLSFICTTTAAPPSQPQRPCLYYNGTHFVLCIELPFSHLAITALTIQVTTTCNRTYHHRVMTTDLCQAIPVSNMTVLPSDCQLANFSITAHSDAGVSQPSPPVTVEGTLVKSKTGCSNMLLLVLTIVCKFLKRMRHMVVLEL